MLPPTQIHILNLRVEIGPLCILLQKLNINYGNVKQTYGLCVTDAHKTSPIVLWGIPLLKQECLPHWAAYKPFHNNSASSPIVIWYQEEHYNDRLLMRDVLKLSEVYL